MQAQGEFLEALWCYENVLRDPLTGHDAPFHQTAALGMARLLLNEASGSEPARRGRLLKRAIAVLANAITGAADEQSPKLLLAETYGLRFALLGERRDLFAAHMQLNAVAEDSQFSPELMAQVQDLRSQLAAIRPSSGLSLRPF